MDTCNKLGEFTITGVERARKGEPKVGCCCAFLGNSLAYRSDVPGSYCTRTPSRVVFFPIDTPHACTIFCGLQHVTINK